MQIKMTMGEKLKDLRVERGLTTKQLCQATGISEAVYNGLENDADRDTGYSRIIALAKFYEVPTDYLLGFTESRITKNIELKQLHLTDKAIEILINRKQNNHLLSQIIEHQDFSNLINSIDVYVRQLAAPNIGTINNMTKVVQHGIENYYSESKDKPEGYNSTLNYINETLVNDDDYLRFRISERFNQILRDVYNANKENVREDIPQRISESNEITGHMVDILAKVKSGELKFDSPEEAIGIMMERMNVGEADMVAAFDMLENNHIEI